MGKYKKLGVNIVTFFVGNMGSRLIQFIFIPMYTYWLTTYEYGIIDTVVITVSLCCPLVSMSIHDALLRFLLEHDGKENEYYSASLFLGAIGSLFFLLSAFVFNSIDLLRPYWLYFYIYMVLSVFFYIQNSLIRGLEYNKLYSGLGVINTLLQALCILLLVGKFRLGIDGYLMSMIIAYASSLLVSIFATKSWNYFSTKYISKCQIQSMLMYSLPLVPNAMMWWVINSSDKYMILYFLSPEANGVFAIASKIPLVINVAYSIFLMAWQISVVEERNQEGKENFYHMIYLCMISGLFIFASFIMIFIKPAILTFLSDGYNETWKYIPLLLISAIFTCLAGYYGSFYVAFKKTGGALKTSMVCAMVSICLNLFLIRYIGLLGVAMSNLISFLTLYVYRIIDTKRFLIIKPESVLVLCNTAILITQTFIIYFLDGYVAFLILIFLFVLMTFINRSLLVRIVAILKEIVQKKYYGKNSV